MSRQWVRNRAHKVTCCRSSEKNCDPALRGIVAAAATSVCMIASVISCRSYPLQGSHNGNDGEVPVTCGNGVLDPGEFCDGAELGGATCQDYGFSDADGLVCMASCHLDPSGCTATCGNAVVEPSEECDGDELGGQTCLDFGYPEPGGLSCDPSCAVDTSNCQGACGNGVVEGTEECDGTNLDGKDCTDYGFALPAGLSCAQDCTSDLSGCSSVCGNGVLEPGELCDATDLGGHTCQDLGFANPAGVTCSAACDLDPSGCSGVCGNGMQEPDEDCEDGNAVEWDGCNQTCQITEFLVNTHTTGDQRLPDVAVAPVGAFVVVWESNGQVAGKDVFTQRYDAQGQKLGGEFQVNTETADNQEAPAVAAASDGSFVVVWQSKDQDGDNWGIYGQLYDSQGNAVGSEFRANTHTASEQRSPSVGATADGSFVVVWESKDQDGGGWGVFGQRFDSFGATAGTEFQVNTYTAGDQRGPSVGVGQGGAFVVAWHSNGQDGDNWGVFARRYDSQGSSLGSEFQVNVHTLNVQSGPCVPVAQDGSFFVVWQSFAQDGGNYGVYRRHYDGSGNATGGEFLVNTTTVDHQAAASAAFGPGGSFVVVWHSRNQDGSNWGVFGQRFDGSATPVDTEFQVNVCVAAEQQAPAVGVAQDGSFVVVWESHNQVDAWDVFGQRYDSQGNAKGVLP